MEQSSNPSHPNDKSSHAADSYDSTFDKLWEAQFTQLKRDPAPSLPDSSAKETNTSSDVPAPELVSGESPDDTLGDVWLGRFRLEKLLGQGGMGEVYLAHDPNREQPIVVKVLPKDMGRHPAEVARARSAFAKVDRLHHENICPVYEFGVDPAEGCYVVMKYIEGVTLGTYREQQGKLPVEEVVRILEPVARALDYAHANRVMHRDIKPHNIMVSADGTNPQIIDFGLSAEIALSMSRVSQFDWGTSGTLAYMAPEQWQGRPQNGCTDQYGLAAVAYELLSGSEPFAIGNTTALRLAVLNDPPPEIEGVPGSANAALARGLAKEPGQRFEKCVDLIHALSGNGKTVAASATSDRNRGSGIAGVFSSLIVLAVLIGGGWLAFTHLEDRPGPSVDHPDPTSSSQTKQDPEKAPMDGTEEISRLLRQTGEILQEGDFELKKGFIVVQRTKAEDANAPEVDPEGWKQAEAERLKYVLGGKDEDWTKPYDRFRRLELAGRRAEYERAVKDWPKELLDESGGPEWAEAQTLAKDAESNLDGDRYQQATALLKLKKTKVNVRARHVRALLEKKKLDDAMRELRQLLEDKEIAKNPEVKKSLQALLQESSDLWLKKAETVFQNWLEEQDVGRAKLGETGFRTAAILALVYHKLGDHPKHDFWIAKAHQMAKDSGKGDVGKIVDALFAIAQILNAGKDLKPCFATLEAAWSAAWNMNGANQSLSRAVLLGQIAYVTHLFADCKSLDEKYRKVAREYESKSNIELQKAKRLSPFSKTALYEEQQRCRFQLFRKKTAKERMKELEGFSSVWNRYSSDKAEKLSVQDFLSQTYTEIALLAVRNNEDLLEQCRAKAEQNFNLLTSGGRQQGLRQRVLVQALLFGEKFEDAGTLLGKIALGELKNCARVDYAFACAMTNVEDAKTMLRIAVQNHEKLFATEDAQLESVRAYWQIGRVVSGTGHTNPKAFFEWLDEVENLKHPPAHVATYCGIADR